MLFSIEFSDSKYFNIFFWIMFELLTTEVQISVVLDHVLLHAGRLFCCQMRYQLEFSKAFY